MTAAYARVVRGHTHTIVTAAAARSHNVTVRFGDVIIR